MEINESVKANSDITAIDVMLEDYNKSEYAIVITLKVFNRLMEHSPKHFSHKGSAILYKGETHVYLHNRSDEEITVQKANN
ncbi:hypothetical protein ACQKKK_15210 [Peribacillus sp. NPDC006672]|uniref:hypothetical protein n=1 Tax=Peribacillus sp. NPDC006672 TaxID=3390606 RepID=UPI003D00687D